MADTGPTTRTVTITLTSHIDDDGWAEFIAETTEEIEQRACNYAAWAANDNYEVSIIHSP